MPDKQPTTLAEWLTWQTQHRVGPAIRLGLDRVRAVADRLPIFPLKPRVITVAGTNGKGSTSMLLASIYQAQGYRTGLYTSPHLWRYEERIQIQGQPVSASALCTAFEQIAQVRHGVDLTYFEWGTLAALLLFAQHDLEVLVLEVGMGGRLDAVNIVDPDCAVITHIALDHQAYLGTDREAIGFQKAGIFRPNRPAVCGDRDIPASIVQEPCARLYQWGKDFDDTGLGHYSLVSGIHPDNLAVVLQTIQVMQPTLPVTEAACIQGVAQTRPWGRQTETRLPDGKIALWDVAHNPDAAAYLAARCAHLPAPRIAVCGMLRDKDRAATLAPLLPLIHAWYVADLPNPRGGTAEELREILMALIAEQGPAQYPPPPIYMWENPCQAWEAARLDPHAQSVVCWGSFLMVGAITGSSLLDTPCD